jgi:NADPH:quinone reductase-like Zn-dependent oxidoreductase
LNCGDPGLFVGAIENDEGPGQARSREGHLDGTGADAGIGPNDVLIKLEKTAICGTDLHIYLWDEWSQRTIKPGLVIGHEFVGRIVEVGPGVTGYRTSASASPPRATSSAAIAATAAPAASTCARTPSASA